MSPKQAIIKWRYQVAMGMKTKRKKLPMALVLWLDDQKSSIIPIADIAEPIDGSEGAITSCFWGPKKNKKLYAAKILKISGKYGSYIASL